MPVAMYKAPVAEQLAILRERAAQFRFLAKHVPLSQHMVAERLTAAAADLDDKADELARSEYA